MNDITLGGTEPCASCGGWQVFRVEREREEKVILYRPVLACWNGHRSYVK